MKKVFIYSLLISGIASGCSSTQSFVQVQNKELYDVATTEDNFSIDGFKDVVIFADNMDNTVWVSPEKNCVTMTKETVNIFSGTTALHIKWDKIAGGCKWIGMGFGWNDWLAKDMVDVVDVAAIQFQVKAVKGTFTNLPVAFAIEDYTGVQSYYGFNATLVQGAFTDQAWRTVTIPLSNFPFQRNDADLAKVKQFMIQLEGDGDIYLDDIRIVRKAEQ